jgi:hypothetical protein
MDSRASATLQQGTRDIGSGRGDADAFDPPVTDRETDAQAAFKVHGRLAAVRPAGIRAC